MRIRFSERAILDENVAVCGYVFNQIPLAMFCGGAVYRKFLDGFVHRFDSLDGISRRFFHGFAAINGNLVLYTVQFICLLFAGG